VAAAVAEATAPGVAVAAINGPTLTVVAGPEDATRPPFFFPIPKETLKPKCDMCSYFLFRRRNRRNKMHLWVFFVSISSPFFWKPQIFPGLPIRRYFQGTISWLTILPFGRSHPSFLSIYKDPLNTTVA